MMNEIEWIERYCCIKKKDETVQRIKLNDAQKEMIKHLSELKDVKYPIFLKRRISYIVDNLVPLLQIQKCIKL